MGKFLLDGAMIPRSVRRVFDQRLEARRDSGAAASLGWRGRAYRARILNLSASGAMVEFDEVPHIGELVELQVPDHGTRQAHVRWVRDGRVGLNFVSPLE